MKYIPTFEQFINESNISEKRKVEFKNVEIDELTFLGPDELTDDDTGIEFNKKADYDSAHVSVNSGKLKNWEIDIYVNDENQIMIQGNPKKGLGEIFHVIKGNKSKAQRIADKLVKTGEVSLK
jgi:hypothetical protein